MILSMTGYAAASRELPQGAITLELRAVNHRYLDLGFRMPDEFRAFEPALRELVVAKLARGKVECRIAFNALAGSAHRLELNRLLLDQLVDAGRQVQSVCPDAGALRAGDILRWPGMLGASTLSADALREQTLALLAAVLEDFQAARAREGAKLAEFISGRIARMQQIVDTVRPKLPRIVAAHREKLVARIAELSAATGSTVAPERIDQELVLYATRIDVEEELARLGAHLAELRRILDQGGAVGKRLDFMMQELNRESNTLGSKSVDVEVSQASMELKLLIEQMREQVQNIE
jgi:uncharacterized protein (TIGR00255 family)